MVEVAGRLGLLARGGLYAVVGILAIRVIDAEPVRADQQGALRAVARQPFGKVLVAALAVGFAAYAAWRMVSAVKADGDGAKPWLKRGTHLGTAVVYGLLAAGAVAVLFGEQAGGSRRQASSATAEVLSWPFGTWLVGAIGLVAGGIGAWFLYEAISRKFLEDLRTERLASVPRWGVETLGFVGHIGRAAVLGVIGWFLVKAAVEFDPGAAAGLDVALHRLARASYGPWLLACIAAGLLCFAAFCVVQAWLRRVTP